MTLLLHGRARQWRMIFATQRLRFKTAEQTFQSRARFELFLLYSLAGHFALCLGLRGIMGAGELSEKPKKKPKGRGGTSYFILADQN